LEPDPVRARHLAQQYAAAFNDAAVEAWGERLDAAAALLDQAAALLDRAAMAAGGERERLVRADSSMAWRRLAVLWVIESRLGSNSLRPSPILFSFNLPL
jgi:hypothetical protein